MRITLGFFFGLMIGIAIWLADRYDRETLCEAVEPYLIESSERQCDADSACIVLFQQRKPIGFYYIGDAPDLWMITQEKPQQFPQLEPPDDVVWSQVNRPYRIEYCFPWSDWEPYEGIDMTEEEQDAIVAIHRR